MTGAERVVSPEEARVVPRRSSGAAPGMAPVLRLVMVGRSHLLRELPFDGWPQHPHIGPLAFRLIGPVPVGSVRLLAHEAAEATRRLGYHSDTFVLVGWGPEMLIALVPSIPCAPHAADDFWRLLTLW